MSGEVPRFGDIMDDIFDSIFEEVTFFYSESDSIFEKNFTDAFKVNEDYVKVATEYKNVINYGASAGHKLGFIEVNFFCLSDWDCVVVKGIDRVQHLRKNEVPFLFKTAHHGRLETWCIFWDEGHDIEAVIFFICTK